MPAQASTQSGLPERCNDLPALPLWESTRRLRRGEG